MGTNHTRGRGVRQFIAVCRERMEEESYGCHSQVETEQGTELAPGDGSVPNTNWRAQLVLTQVCGQQGTSWGEYPWKGC